ncbi:MAG TPA: DsrE/DsrF/DrsH-like family protein [Ktedonobacterales bacterium]|nr:DsrE/DsrF/DrsH-like family protein [Ktedonobacterales bacterium]
MYGEFPLDGQGLPGALPTPAGSTPPATANRLAIVLFSGTIDRLMSASIMATGAAAMGMDVEIFLTNWGALAFRKGDYHTNRRVSASFADYQSYLLEQMAAKNVTSWMENLEGAKEIGNVHIAACSHTMTLFDLTLEDMEPIVDEVTGVAAFLERAHDSAMTLYI